MKIRKSQHTVDCRKKRINKLCVCTTISVHRESIMSHIILNETLTQETNNGTTFRHNKNGTQFKLTICGCRINTFYLCHTTLHMLSHPLSLSPSLSLPYSRRERETEIERGKGGKRQTEKSVLYFMCLSFLLNVCVCMCLCGCQPIKQFEIYVLNVASHFRCIAIIQIKIKIKKLVLCKCVFVPC